MKKLIYLGLFILLLLCCTSRQRGVEKIIEDGVEVVINHIEPYQIRGESSSLMLEEKLRIDFERPDLAEKGISEVSGVEIDSHGNIYVLDQWNRENFVYKFDGHGKYITAFGKTGQGPGELQLPTLSMNAQDEICMLDSRARKQVVFDSSGNLIREEKLKKNITDITPLSNGNFLVSEYVYFQEEGTMISSLYVSTPDFTVIKELYRRRSQDARTSERIEGLVRTGVRALNSRNIFLGDTRWDYEIRVFDLNGNLLKRIRKDYSPVPVSEEYKQQHLQRYEGDPENQRKMYFPDFLPPYQFGFVSENGYLFVMTYEKGINPREMIYDIFNPEGAFVGRVNLDNYGQPWKFEAPLAAKSKLGNIYCVRQKDSNFFELVVYRMIWE